MSLINELKNTVKNTIFNRGLRYYQNNHVYSYDYTVEDNKRYILEAVVIGSRQYKVHIDVFIEQGRLYYDNDCSCPYDWSPVCKHTIAVLYKFLKEDYPVIKSQKKLERGYQKLLELSKTEEELAREGLKYYIKGLIDDSLVNFKITLQSDQISSRKIEKIISYIHDNFLLYNNRLKSIVNSKDIENINKFAELETTRSQTENSFLLTKDRDSFDFIMKLIEKSPVFLMETDEVVQTGEVLIPDMVLSGNEDEVQIKLDNLSYDIKQAKYSDVFWSVFDSTLHPVRMKEIRELPNNIVIPDDRKGEFLFEILPVLAEKYSIKIDDNLKKYELIRREPVIELKFDYYDQAISCRANIEIDGKNFSGIEMLGIDLEKKEYTRSRKDRHLWYLQDNQPVQELLDLMDRYGFRVRPDEFILRSESDIKEFITDGFLHLPEDWQIKTTEAFDSIEISKVDLKPVIELKDNDSDSINWFEFEITYNLGGKTYTRNQLQQMVSRNKQGESYIRVDNQYFIFQESEEENRVNDLLDLAESDKENDVYRSNFYNLLYYRKLIKETGISFKGNKVYNELDNDISGDTLVKEVQIPAEVQNILRNYQKEGYYWLHFLNKYHFGGILADDMGLGKTVQTLTLIKSLNRENPSLVVCPRTLIYNWQEEVDKYFPGLKSMVYYGTPAKREEMLAELGEYDLVITSYSIISRDYKKINNTDTGFEFCILDEAHHIKNHRTKRARGVKQINSNKRLALTGTPLENSIDELWSIFDFLMPGYLSNYNKFKKDFINPISKDNNTGKLKKLKERVAPFILRRKKEEVLTELPEKIINIQPVEMTKLQEDTYRTILEQVKGELLQTVEEKGFNRSHINILAALTRLRQVCNHPSLVLDKVEKKDQSGKIEALMELVEDAVDGGHKLIIFSQFVKMLKLIRDKFNSKGIIFEYLDGSTRKRMERVNRFNNDNDIQAFLISLKAGGIGLNLTAADIVVHVDPWWNPMVERQATDRAHRLGQEKRVMVYKLITRGTVEEKMIKLQQKKEELFNNIIENNVDPLQAITWEDIQELLSVGR
ncbi:MAG: SNF2-related protein [Halothermotrichaceae bacterium]